MMRVNKWFFVLFFLPRHLKFYRSDPFSLFFPPHFPAQEAIFLEGRHGRAVQLGECVIVRRARHPLLCFARINPSCDWVHDLGARLAYERQVRMME
jgi:hypothetical protein